MVQDRDTHGFVVLDRDACLDRLARRHLASVAVTNGALPLVLPVQYSLHGEDILVGADRAGVLGRRLPNHVVSLCVHDVDDELARGWSVTVTGLAEPADHLATTPAVAPLRRWGANLAEQVVVRIRTDMVSGREISS